MRPSAEADGGGAPSRTETALPAVCWSAALFIAGVVLGGLGVVFCGPAAGGGGAAGPSWGRGHLGAAAVSLVGVAQALARPAVVCALGAGAMAAGAAWHRARVLDAPPRWRAAVACVVALAAGAAHGTAAYRGVLADGARLASMTGPHVGRVSSDPAAGPFGTDTVVTLERGGARVRLCVEGDVGELWLGDEVSWTGTLRPLEPGKPADAAALLAGTSARGRVDGTLLGRRPGRGVTGPLYRWRRVTLSRWLSSKPDRQSRALVAAMVLGYRPRVDEVTTGVFRRSGLSHLLAVSGTHAAVVAGFLGLIVGLAGGGARARRCAAVAGLSGYAVMTGLQPSVLRVSVALGWGYLAWHAGKRTSSAALLGVAAASLAALWPWMVFSAGYRLSFAAALGLVLWGGPLAARLGAWAPPRVAAALGATLSAQLAVTPMMATDFSQVSLVAPLANLAALPAVAPLLGGGLVAAGGSAAGAVLGAAPALRSLFDAFVGGPGLWVADACASWVAGIGTWCARWPWAAVAARGLPLAAWPLYYVALDAWMLGRWRSRGLRRAAGGGGVAVACAVSLALAGWVAWPFARPVPARMALETRILDVGQGDAILLRTAGGRTVLVDGGPSGGLLKRRLAEARVGSLDLVVVTHAHADHYKGLVAAVCDLSVGELWRSPCRGTEAGYEVMLRAARRRGVRVRAPPAGSTARIDRWLTLEVVWPPIPPPAADLSVNDQSLVLVATSGARRILLTGDITERAQTPLAASPERIRCDVYKAAHHGSAGSLEPAFLDALGARLAVISVGEGNRYGHPSARALEEFGARGMSVARTDRAGTIVVVTDGTGVWVRPPSEGSGMLRP